MIVHLVAHSLIGQKPLADPAAASWLWRRLRASWPRALAACLMPNHVHLLVPTRAPEDERQRLARVLAGLSRRNRTERSWITAPPERVGDVNQLKRQIRYIHLNPCRAGLADDPMSWHYSTHRGLIGAEVNPWVLAAELADALGRRRDGFEAWVHRYVSGDPSVAPEGTPFPCAAPERTVPEVPLGVIVKAATVATRWASKPIRRKTIVQLARHQGWRVHALIANAAGISLASTYRLANSVDPTLLVPAALCLGDSRLG